MRSLAFWGVCPDTGSAGFSGRTLPGCDCARPQRHTACRQSVRSSLQQPGPPSNNSTYRQQNADRSQARAVSLTWPEEWQSQDQTPDTDSQSSDQPKQSWDKGFFSPVQQQGSNKKPLKINQDLLLYSARQSRVNAFRANSSAQKLRSQKSAEASLRRVLSMDATDGRAYVSLGKLLMQQRRFDEARELYDDGATATGGLNEFVWQAWAHLEAKQGNIGQARKLYDAALVANKAHAASWHGWGLLEKKQGNYRKARDLWMKGLKATKDKPNPYLYQALALMATELRYTEEARQWFLEGTKTIMGSQSNAIWHAWAQMEATQGDRTVVRYLYRRCLEINTRSRFAYLSWGLFEKEEGNVENARALLKQGHQLNQQDAAILQAWALLEQAAGNDFKARELFETGSLVDPTHVHVWQAWGILEFKAGNVDRARALFQEGVWADPVSQDVALVFQAWGVLEARHGTTQLARELFKCAVKADPKSEKSWASWAHLEETEGCYQRAAELRSYSLQEQTSFVPPLRLGPKATEDPIFAPIFGQITQWLARFEEGRAKAMSRGRPRALQHLQEADESFWESDRDSRQPPPLLDLQEAKEYNTQPLDLPVFKESSQKSAPNGYKRPHKRQ